MVTHQPEDAKYAASKIAFVDAGRVSQVLPTAAFFADNAPVEIRRYLA
jgi:ABC-type thiamine transport system ATPase subunit